jgi:MFS family permease
VVAVGYLLTGSGLSLFAFAKSWPLILVGRLISWFGKGIRGSLRNAMLTESVPPEVRGKAFGFHRAGDTVGAILGPLLGVALLRMLPPNPPDAPFRTIFLVSLIPGLAAPILFALIVKDRARGGMPGLGLWTALRNLPGAYRRFLKGVGVFGMGDFSPTLLVLAATTILTPRFGALRAAETAALLYTVRNVVYAAGSFPVGVLADRWNKRTLLAMGYATGGATAFGMALAFSQGTTSIPALAGIFVLSGLFAAAQDTLEGAVPPEFVPDAKKGGTVYGALGGVNGFGDLIASAMTGTVWTLVSPVTAFALAALLLFAGARMVAGAKPG